MTKDQVNRRCENIARELSPAAYDAYYLAGRCLSARFWWRQNCDDMDKQFAYGAAATELENYCTSNKQIRGEAQLAIRKLDNLIKEASVYNPANDSYRERKEKINYKLGILRNAKNKKTGQNRKFFRTMKIIMAVSFLLFAICFTANIFFFDTTLAMFSTECFMAFLVSLIILIVKSNNIKKEISSLESELFNIRKIEKDNDMDLISNALRAKDCYELIIRGTHGNSLADYR